MKTNSLAVQIVIFFTSYSLGIADDGTARRYADSAEDNISRTYALLERKDIQEELKLTPDQIEKVKQISYHPDRDVPGLPKLMDDYRNKESAPALSNSDKEKLRESFESDLRKCMEAYLNKALPEVLSASQMQQLAELLIQMQGPLVLMNDT